MRIRVDGEAQPDIQVTGGQPSRVIDVGVGSVFSVNGQTGAVRIDGVTDWVNASVAPFSADRTGIIDATAAIQAAINACQPGGVVYLPRGTYKTTATLDLRNGVTLRGSHAAMMVGPGMSAANYPCYIQPAASFTGTSVIQIIGDSDGTHPDISAEQRIIDVTIDGSLLGGSSIDGLYARGNVQNVVLDGFTVRQIPNNGIVTASRTSDGQYPFSWRLRRVMVDNCHANGILLTGCTDVTLDDVQAIGCWGQGIVLTNCPNGRIIDSRAEWNGSHGIHITGAWGDWTGSGGMHIADTSTDRNGQHGVFVDATGNTPILITGLATRRDGRNGGAGGAGYAGLAVIGATVPVTVDGVTCYPGIDDEGTSTNSPQYGARLSGAASVTLDGAHLHGATAGLYDDGTNTLVSYGPNIVTAAGATTSAARTLRPPLLDWINVRQRGAKADGTTDDTAAIQAALNAAGTGGTVYLPAGTYATSAPLTVPPGVTLRGSHGDHFDNLTGWTQVNARIKPLASFAGVAAILILDAPLGGYAAKSCEQRLLDLTLDGSALPGGNSVDGIQAQGTIRGMVFENISIKKFGAHAVYFTYNFSAPPACRRPYSCRLRRIVASDCGGNTFSFNNTTDTTMIDVEAIGNSGYGFFLSGCGNSTLIACRAEWNLRGFHIAPGNAQLSLIGCSTDRNTQNGILVTGGSAGATVNITNARLNRDGRNGGSGGGGYAGLAIDTCLAIVNVTDISVLTGIDDDGSGTRSPQYGVNAVGSSYVAVNSGILNAATTGFRDGGTNTTLLRGPNVSELIGNPASPSSTTSYGLRTTQSSAQFVDSSAVAYNLVRPAAILPLDHGFAAWAYDPYAAGTNQILSGNGILHLVRIPVRAPRTITNIVLYVGSAGATLTAGACWAGIYDSSGNRLGQTADQATAWTTTGTKTMAIAAGPLTLAEGNYWVAIVATGTTLPQFPRGSNVGGPIINVGLSAANTRFGTYGTAGTYTTLPATITPASISNNTAAWWAALS